MVQYSLCLGPFACFVIGEKKIIVIVILQENKEAKSTLSNLTLTKQILRLCFTLSTFHFAPRLD